MGLPTNPAAENVLATIGTICWTVQLVPQIWKSYREKSTKGLSPWLVLIWGVAGAFLGVYVIVQDLNIPLIVQPQSFGVLAILSWAQCQYYGNGRSLRTCVALLFTILAICGGFEAGMVFAVEPSFRAGNKSGVQFFGVFSSIIISLALVPQFWEIYRHREVVGISIPFMTVDWLGGIFNLLSLVFKKEFDAIAGVTFSMVVLLDGLVLLSAAILNPLARRRRAREAEAEVVTGIDMSPSPTIHVSVTEEVKGEEEKRGSEAL